MASSTWKNRFFGTTRGEIVTLLRRSSATVTELAGRLRLTDNAVRTHLAALERDGLVEQHGLQRGMGKPAYVYRLTPEAEGLFPKAYAVVLRTLLDVLRARLDGAELREVLETTGRQLAAPHARADAGLRVRAEAAAVLLGELGGMAEVEERPEGMAIQGYSCPLAAVAGEHPQVCGLAAVLLEEVVGAPVREACDRDGAPRCRFLVGR